MVSMIACNQQVSGVRFLLATHAGSGQGKLANRSQSLVHRATLLTQRS